MKSIKLKKLIIKNFKGCEKFVFSPNCKNASISGDNATMKTTVFDAFTWLLSGKDSLNSAAFEIKPIGSDGSGVECNVEAVLCVNNTDILLKRVLAEKWTKKRGEAHKVFTGNQTLYYIDEVPVKEKEYKAYINDLCPDWLSILLISPKYFNELISWQDRRKIILDVCGDISDQEVIDNHFELEPLPGILGKHTIDNYKKIAESQRKKINSEMVNIPVRIDEISKSKTETREKSVVESDIESVVNTIKNLQTTLNNINSNGPAQQLESELIDIDNQIKSIESEDIDKISKLKTEYNEQLEKLIVDANRTVRDMDDKSHEIKMTSDAIASIESEISALNNEIIDLRQKWHKYNDEVFVPPDALMCPACGYDLSEESREHGLNEFNIKKSKKLEFVNHSGKELSEKIDGLVSKMSKHSDHIEKLYDELNQLKTKSDTADKKLVEFRTNNALKTPVNPKKTDLLAKKAVINAKIANLNTGDEIRDITTQIKENERILDMLKEERIKIDANCDIDARIEELSSTERKLSNDLEKFDHHLYLIDQFIRAKVSMLEEHINSQFEITKWKLFEEQINEGLKQCCIATINGVPYHSVNNAGKVNCGLDCINTLSKRYNYQSVIWIDNCESITNPLKTEAQQIRLIVSEKDKNLRVI